MYSLLHTFFNHCTLIYTASTFIFKIHMVKTISVLSSRNVAILPSNDVDRIPWRAQWQRTRRSIKSRNLKMSMRLSYSSCFCPVSHVILVQCVVFQWFYNQRMGSLWLKWDLWRCFFLLNGGLSGYLQFGHYVIVQATRWKVYMMFI